VSESPRPTEGQALLGAVAFVAFGLALAITVKSAIPGVGDVAFVAVLVLPLIAYLILSDRFAEFTLPGGISAKLARASREPVAPAVRTSIQSVRVIQKGNRADLKRSLEGIAEASDAPLVMVVELGQDYSPWMFSQYLSELARYRGFRFLVIVDGSAHLVGYVPAEVFRLPGMQSEQDLTSLVFTISAAQIPALLSVPGMISESLRLDSTVADGLSYMNRHRLRSGVVTDTQSRLVGIVDREDLVVQLLLAIGG